MTERKYFDYDEKELTPAQAAKRRYKQRNREKVLASAREWAKKDRLENPKKHKEQDERQKENMRKWCEKNKEKLTLQRKENYLLNKDRIEKKKKEWREKNPEKVKGYQKKYLTPEKSYKKTKEWREKNPEKWKAQCKANNAIQSGKLMKPLNCQICNVKTKLEKHHRDYNEPLDITWCCRSCHGKLDRIRREAKT